MNWLIIFALLWLKHGLLANVLDWGYSASRHEPAPHYLLSLTRQLILEALLTVCILSRVSPGITFAILVAEMLVQALTCLVERRATVYQQLQYHLLCEIALIVTYFALVLLLPFIHWLLS